MMLPAPIAGPRRLATAAIAAAVAVLAAGCSGGSAGETAAATVSPAACRTLPPSQLPRAAGSLTEVDSGTYCLPLGRTVQIFLTAPGDSHAPSARWSQPHSSASQVAQPVSSGMLTAPLGVTPGIFFGATRGTTVISSATPSGKTWQISLVVR